MASKLDLPLPSWSRWILLAFAAWLAAASWAGWYRWRGTNDNLNRLITISGLPDEQLRQRIEWERNPDYAKLDVARAIVHQAHDQRSLQGLAPEELAAEIDARLARLPIAGRLALDVLEHHPGSWEASLFLGASTYLEWALSRDSRLFTESERWQEPLLASYRTAPAKEETRLFLLAAYLELWPALSDERRAEAREMLRLSFAEDRNAWSRLGSLWLERARDVDEAFALLPADPGVWSRVESAYARRREWRPFLAARERRLETAEARVRELVELARRQRSLGDATEAARSYSAALELLPVDARFASLLEEAVLEHPPGLGSRELVDRFEEWTRWATRLHELGLPSLDPRAFNRLAAVTPPGSLPEEALAALAADELYRGEHLESRAETLALEAWAPYLLCKARELIERKEVEAAEHTLDKIVLHARSDPLYWALRLRVAEAKGAPAEILGASREVAALRRARWTTLDWTWPTDLDAELRIFPSAEARGFRIGTRGVAEDGAAGLLRWNGVTVWTGAVRAGQTVDVNVEVGTEPGLLQLRTLAGENRIVPDVTVLLGVAASGEPGEAGPPVSPPS